MYGACFEIKKIGIRKWCKFDSVACRVERN